MPPRPPLPTLLLCALLRAQGWHCGSDWKRMQSRHRPLHSSTFSWRIIAFLMLFSMSLEQTSALFGAKLKKKPGVCLKERITCPTKVVGSCSNDFDCKDYLKCCSFACENKCMDPYQEPCLQTLDPGNCQDNLNRWYFDFKLNQCTPFVYRGCGGNANNFASEDYCKKACKLLVKDGQCPLFPHEARLECPETCKSDFDCPEKEKCCDTQCGFTCLKAWKATVRSCFAPPNATCQQWDKSAMDQNLGKHELK
ncbi:WAP four-disulfide core domain protein 8 [Ctenodactylus gundi]